MCAARSRRKFKAIGCHPLADDMGMATATQPRILTTPEAGALIGRSDETVRRLIAAGKVRARMIGGRWFVDADSLAELEQDGEGSS